MKDLEASLNMMDIFFSFRSFVVCEASFISPKTLHLELHSHWNYYTHVHMSAQDNKRMLSASDITQRIRQMIDGGKRNHSEHQIQGHTTLSTATSACEGILRDSSWIPSSPQRGASPGSDGGCRDRMRTAESRTGFKSIAQALLDENDMLRDETQMLKQELSQLRQERNHLRERCAQLEQQVAQVSRTNERLSLGYDALRADIQSLSAVISAQNGKLDACLEHRQQRHRQYDHHPHPHYPQYRQGSPTRSTGSYTLAEDGEGLLSDSDSDENSNSSAEPQEVLRNVFVLPSPKQSYDAGGHMDGNGSGHMKAEADSRRDSAQGHSQPEQNSKGDLVDLMLKSHLITVSEKFAKHGIGS